MMEHSGRPIKKERIKMFKFYYMDGDAYTCARYHNVDTREKVITEYMRILSTVFWKLKYKEEFPWKELKGKDTKKEVQASYKEKTNLYVPSYVNDDVVDWCTASYGNRKFLFNVLYYLLELHGEHKCDTMFTVVTDLFMGDRLKGTLLPMTIPPKSMDDKYKIGEDTKFEDVIKSYRNLYVEGKNDINFDGGVPEWYTYGTQVRNLNESE